MQLNLMKFKNSITLKMTVAFCVGLMLFTACSSNEPTGGPVAARITANIALTSRAIGTAWQAGDKIGITTTGNLKQYTNIEYTTAEGNGLFSGTPIYFQDATSEVTFTAYYPFAGSEGTAAGILTGKTDADSQKPENQPLIDYLWDSSVAKKDAPQVNFQFAHKMSKLTLTFQDGNDTDVSKVTSYSIEGLTLEGTFDTANGVAAKKEDAPAETLTIDVTNAVSGSTLPSLILYPQRTNGYVALCIAKDGQNYNCELTFPDDELQKGQDYNFTITINKTGLEVTKSSISPWTSQILNGEATL